MAQMDDEKLYEELLTLYSDLVILIVDAIKMCDAERDDPKKVFKH